MIIGIDASISSTGYSVITTTGELINCGKVTTTAKMEEDDRIHLISNTIIELCKNYEVTKIVIDAQFFKNNIKTALQLSRLRGALTFVGKYLGAEIVHITPSEIRKNLTGDGNISKEDVALWISDFYTDNDLVTELGEFCYRQCKKKNNDIYDTIEIALSEINKKVGIQLYDRK